MYKVSETVLPIYINGQCPIIKTCSDVTLNLSSKDSIFETIIPVYCVTNNASIGLYQPTFKMHGVHVLR